ncbi:DEAD/DEAH box helicase family protein [Bacillus safensis]|uniref:DEAD/DEAH box helicase family protein n=1 Tax=Bacillus safensis TaxID=561879 RepID=UPI000B44B7CB|nr:DEAD/DEAH box helicase family protein [Bacillus safensis]PAK34011.1 DEAD/DEAH box helicase [Bacillus safensis]UDB51567.1 DEAD/DEAH box helicase family protein [Bacillus safensis]
MLDFNKLLNDTLQSAINNPIEIFDLLPSKNEKYEGLLRHAQNEVLNKWYEKHYDDTNTIIKMNTGSGKTVIGLLILQSLLNDGKGPAVYIVPDNYLIEQIIREAHDLGIKVTKDPKDIDFETGDAILVINIHRILNGRSTFGVNEIQKHIGCLVVDDAHACIKIAKSQFAISIPRKNPLYQNLLEVFNDSIKHQNESKLLELTDGDKGVQQLIPFWEWQSKVSTVRRLLHNQRNNKEEYNKSLFYNWALLKDNLELADCIFSSEEIIINLDFIPMEVIPSFNDCPHRIFMSATIEDDTVLVSHFNIDSSLIEESITPEKANDIGERLIVIPQEINPEITDNDLKSYFKNLAKHKNIVILVPSEYRSTYWRDIANIIVKTQDELINTTNKLKHSHLGLVVLINRYDGIDLPKNACQILVLDGLPDVRSEFEKFEEIVLRDSSETLTDKIQRIEQGMGRGVRSKEDYCVVFLMGNSLVKTLYTPGAKDAFSEATRKQLELSRNINKQLVNGTLEEINTTINYCLQREKKWVTLHNATILKVKYNSRVCFNSNILSQKLAFDAAKGRNYIEASEILQNLINSITAKKYKGFLKYKLAKYINFHNSILAQENIISAKSINNHIPYPIEGITYSKLQFNNIPQAENIVHHNNRKYSDTNEYVLGFKSILDKLHFNDYSANTFEQAIKDLGMHLGFISQRPENDFNKGPDNLWATGENSALVIECKNEAESRSISKKYCNQLNGSLIWFKNYYPLISNVTPLMIHPYNKFENAASPHQSVRIITKEKLEELRRNLWTFLTQVASCNYDMKTISRLLREFNLEHELFLKHYTVRYVQ